MAKYFLILLLAGTVRHGLADEATPFTPFPAPIALPVYAVAARPSAMAAPLQPTYSSTAAPANNAPDAMLFLSKADHLRQAASHLEAAGLSDEAARFRQLAANEQASAPTDAIQVELRMVELPLNKLANTTSERYGGSKDMSVQALLMKLCSSCALPRNRGYLPSSDPKLLALLDALGRDGIVDELSEPSLMVSSGRPATVNVSGARADVLAFVTANGQVHLDFRLRVSRPDVTLFCAGIPPMKNREMEAGIDLRSGQTVVIVGPVEWRNSSNGESMQTFALARAQILTKVAPSKPASVK